MKNYILFILLIFSGILLHAQVESIDTIVSNYNIGEVEVLSQYKFKSKKEERRYNKLEADMRVVYPFLKLVIAEYGRVNEEMKLYDKKKRKEYLKWYEKYVYKNYIGHIVEYKPRQGRLLLKLINLELENSPYELIKEYRNGFRAILWQAAAMLLGANMNSEFKEDEIPMIKYLLRKMAADAELQQINLGKTEDEPKNIELFH